MELDTEDVSAGLNRAEVAQRELLGSHTRFDLDSSKIFTSRTDTADGCKRWNFFYRAHQSAPLIPLVSLNVDHLFGIKGEVIWQVVPCKISYDKAEKRAREGTAAGAPAPADLKPFSHNQLYFDLVDPGTRV